MKTKRVNFLLNTAYLGCVNVNVNVNVNRKMFNVAKIAIGYCLDHGNAVRGSTE